MKEMHDSTILDREIRDEAARQAARRLAEADRECGRLRGEAGQALRSALSELEAGHARQRDRLRADSAAALHLARRRLRLDFLGRELDRAVRAAVSALPEAEFRACLEPRVIRAASGLGAGAISARLTGAWPEPAATLGWLRGLLPDRRLDAASGAADPGTAESGPAPGRGLELASADGRGQYRVGEDSLADWLLGEFRAELADALFPGLADGELP